MEINFKKVNYEGDGYMHIMENLETGKQEYFPCSKEQYELMGGVNGEKYNPVMEGYKHISSCQGTIKTDSENTCLNPFEYCENGNEIFLTLRNKNGGIFQVNLDKGDLPQ